MRFNIKREVISVKQVLLHYAMALATHRQALAMVLLSVLSLLAVVTLYLGDHRLSQGSWHTYGDGLFSVKEDRHEHFDEFHVPQGFKTRLQERGGGQLLGAYQKSVLAETGRVDEIFHINVYSLDSWFKHFYSGERRVYRRYLSQRPSLMPDCDVKRVPDYNGHPAIVYKSKTRDQEGYYMRGMVVCAHRKAYYYECYSHYSPYADWQNDAHTYFYPIDEKGCRLPFTVGDMNHIEMRFFLLSFLFFGVFLFSSFMVYRLFTRPLDRQGGAQPILNAGSHQRFHFIVALTAIMVMVMVVMLISFWQYRGAKVLQSVAYVLVGLILLSFNLPVLVHLYKKARLAPPLDLG